MGRAYLRREICVSKSARLILGAKFTSQNRLGSSWLEVNFISNLQKVFTETSLENVDLTETKPCLSFVYMERGNPSQELRVNYANSNIV